MNESAQQAIRDRLAWEGRILEGDQNVRDALLARVSDLDEKIAATQREINSLREALEPYPSFTDVAAIVIEHCREHGKGQ